MYLHEFVIGNDAPESSTTENVEGIYFIKQIELPVKIEIYNRFIDISHIHLSIIGR